MGGAGTIEIEAKLVVVGPGRQALLDALARRDHLAGLALEEPQRLEIVDEYYDLRGAPLAARDAALRLRRVHANGPERVLLTLKGPARAAEGLEVARDELEADWSPAALERVRETLATWGLALPASDVDLPPEAAAALAALGLAPVQLRAAERRSARLLRAGVAVAELCLDRVTYRPGTRDVVHRELEIEALPPSGAAEVSRIAAELLTEQPSALRAWRVSKTALGRALDELEARGELAALLDGEELSEAGYDELRDRLPSTRPEPRSESR